MVKIFADTKRKVATLKEKMTQQERLVAGNLQKHCSSDSKDIFSYWKCPTLKKRYESKIVKVGNPKLTPRQVRNAYSLNIEVSVYKLHRVLRKKTWMGI